MVGRRLLHFRIAVGMAETVEVEAPHVEAGVIQRVTPGPSIEAVRDRQCRRKGRAVYVKHRAARPKGRVRRGQKTQEQRHSFARPRNVEMLFSRIKLGTE